MSQLITVPKVLISDSDHLHGFSIVLDTSYGTYYLDDIDVHYDDQYLKVDILAESDNVFNLYEITEVFKSLELCREITRLYNSIKNGFTLAVDEMTDIVKSIFSRVPSYSDVNIDDLIEDHMFEVDGAMCFGFDDDYVILGKCTRSAVMDMAYKVYSENDSVFKPLPFDSYEFEDAVILEWEYFGD